MIAGRKVGITRSGAWQQGRMLPTYRSDIPFVLTLGLIIAVYVVLIVGMLLAMVFYVEFPVIGEVFTNERYRYAVLLSLISCSITTILSLWVEGGGTRSFI